MTKPKRPKTPRGKRTDPPRKKGPKYRAEMCPQVSKLMDLGLTFGEIADFIGIDERTLRNWKVHFPELRAALSMSDNVANERVKVSLFNQAVGYWVEEEEIKIVNGEVKHIPVKRFYPPSPAAAIYWSRVKMGWRVDEEPEQPTADGEKTIEGVAVPMETTRQLARRVALVLHQGGKKSA